MEEHEEEEEAFTPTTDPKQKLYLWNTVTEDLTLNGKVKAIYDNLEPNQDPSTNLFPYFVRAAIGDLMCPNKNPAEDASDTKDVNAMTGSLARIFDHIEAVHAPSNDKTWALICGWSHSHSQNPKGVYCDMMSKFWREREVCEKYLLERPEKQPAFKKLNQSRGGRGLAPPPDELVDLVPQGPPLQQQQQSTDRPRGIALPVDEIEEVAEDILLEDGDDDEMVNAHYSAPPVAKSFTFGDDDDEEMETPEPPPPPPQKIVPQPVQTYTAPPVVTTTSPPKKKVAIDELKIIDEYEAEAKAASAAVPEDPKGGSSILKLVAPPAAAAAPPHRPPTISNETATREASTRKKKPAAAAVAAAK